MGQLALLDLLGEGERNRLLHPDSAPRPLDGHLYGVLGVVEGHERLEQRLTCTSSLLAQGGMSEYYQLVT